MPGNYPDVASEIKNTYPRRRAMPYSPAQTRTFRAIEHGWKPRKKSLRRLSAKKAGRMADEGVATTHDAARDLAQRRQR